jgi:D-galactose 1-dehydrogenase
MTASLKLGLVGYGKIARDQHVPAIATTAGMQLVAVASPNTRADGVHNYPDLAGMLAGEPVLDAIILCQPPQARFEAARTALLAGKHVFLEKPPGATLSEAEALITIAGDAGVTLFASWHSREAAMVAQARQWLQGKSLEAVRVDWKEDVRVWHPGQDWIWEPGGFGVFDPGINALSILTDIVPENIRLCSAELDVPSNRSAPIAARLALETASGVPIAAEFDFRQTGPQSWDILVQTTAGDMMLSHGGNALTLDGVEQPQGEEREYPALYARFANLVARQAIDVDLAPLRLVADAFLKGRSCLTEPFFD